jgi:hypothetical protein
METNPIKDAGVQAFNVTADLKPHIIEDLPFSEYAALPYVNHSRLKLIKRDPQRFYLSTIVGEDLSEDRDAYEVGRAAHTLVLEPEKFDAEYMCMEKGKRRSTGNRSDDGKFQLTYTDSQLVTELASAFHQNAHASKLIKDTKRELTVVFEYEGVWCKARIDIYDPILRMASDYKTSKSADPLDFQESFYYYGYFTQAAYYQAALRAVGMACDDFTFIVGEKSYPYYVGVFPVKREVLEIGDQVNRFLLRKVKHHMVTNTWPHYCTDIVTLGLTDRHLNNIKGEYGI